MKICLKPILIVTVSVLTAAAILIGLLLLWGLNPSVPHGLSVSGMRMDGMSVSAFAQKWDEQLQMLQNQTVSLQSTRPGIPSVDLTLHKLGLTVDDTTVKTMIAQLSQESVFQRTKAKFHYRYADLPVYISLKKETMEQMVQTSWKSLYDSHPVSAKRLITSDDQIRYEEGKSVPRIQMDTLYEEIRNQLPRLGTLSAEQKSIPIRLPIYDQQPEITVSTLQNQGVERKIMEYSTKFNDQAEGRLHNVRSTAAVLNEQLLKPGEVFDYAKMIELAEQQYGFKEAPVIVNGKLVPGVGGGICQVSTTLYNAILRTGLEIVERRNHSLPISYAPLGQDATFSSGHINFKFRNNTGAHLLIITQTSANGLTVKLFGKIPSNISYDIISKTVETLPPAIKYVHNPALKDGQQETIQSGKPGYIVETYRYKKQDGKVITAEKISRDRYNPQPTIISSNQEKMPSGSSDESPPDRPFVEDGIKGPTNPGD